MVRQVTTAAYPRSVPRLLLLNGPPGIGKSTLARRYAEDRPGTLVLDIDLVRSLLGGWQEDFVRAGRRARPLALAMLRTHLDGGHDVVLPQLLADPRELERFTSAAAEVDAEVVEVLLLDQRDAVVERFRRRGETDPDPWHERVRAIVDAEGGDRVLRHYHDRLLALVELRPRTRVVPTTWGEVDAAYSAVLAACAGDP